jgi:hypothetical protein
MQAGPANRICALGQGIHRCNACSLHERVGKPAAEQQSVAGYGGISHVAGVAHGKNMGSYCARQKQGHSECGCAALVLLGSPGSRSSVRFAVGMAWPVLVKAVCIWVAQ